MMTMLGAKDGMAGAAWRYGLGMGLDLFQVGECIPCPCGPGGIVPGESMRQHDPGHQESKKLFDIPPSVENTDYQDSVVNRAVKNDVVVNDRATKLSG